MVSFHNDSGLKEKMFVKDKGCRYGLMVLSMRDGGKRIKLAEKDD